MRLDEIQIRDPFVLPDKQAKAYYLFGSTDKNIWGKGTGFDAYTSQNLENWDGPFPVFRPDEHFWSTENFWAPEVHVYHDEYYMLATFLDGRTGYRGTAVLKSLSPLGPFIPHSDGPVTPSDWFSLDGTLHVDHSGSPWLVFCHEWVQVGDGEICAVQLTADLRSTAGPVQVLFRASESGWATPKAHNRPGLGISFVTDGPYLHRSSNGTLFLVWSSFVNERYAIGVAHSATGMISGPWVHHREPLCMMDAGHGMTFRAHDGELFLAIHTPNQTPAERCVFLRVDDDGYRLTVG